MSAQRTYECFWRNKRITIQAETTLKAQELAQAQFKAKRRFEITVCLADVPVAPASL